MSKKSRKRNKKILAAIGIGLGAAALASKKKAASASDVESNDNAFREKTKSIPTGPKELGISTAKKDTAVKTKTTIQDNKSKDTAKKPIPGIRVGKNSITASKYDKDTPNKTFSGPDRKYDYKNRASEKNAAGIAKPKKYAISMANLLPKSGAAKEFAASTQDYNRSNQAYKSGGRVKGCGKALRGFGKAMKGKR